MKKYFNNIIMALILGLNLFLLYSVNNLSIKLNRYKEEIFSVNKDIERLSNFHMTSQRTILLNEQYKIPYNFILENEKGTRINFTELIGSKSKLIFRYSGLNCNTCIEEEIINIKKYLSETKTQRLIIIADYKNEEDLFLFKRLHQIGIPIYNSRQNSLKLPIEALNTPYLFVTDSTLIIRSLFIPNKEYPEFSKVYYSNIFSSMN